MAIIIRDRLTGQAKDIADRAISSSIAKGNQALINLGQQSSMLASKQQGFVAMHNESLNQAAKNIYHAQRQQKADAAMRGMVGQVSAIQQQAELQDQVAQSIGSIISQAEQGAISIAGEQSAINKAELQYAAPEVLDEIADELILEGKYAKRDYGREVWSGLTGALTGAIGGLVGGKLLLSGAKAFSGPGGYLKKGLAGAGIVGAGGLLANQIGQTVNIATGEQLYSDRTSSDMMKGTLMGGALAGLAGAGVSKMHADVMKNYLGIRGIDYVPSSNTPFQSMLSKLSTNPYTKKVASEAAESAGKTAMKTLAAEKGIGKALNKGANKASKFGRAAFKMNPWYAATMAGVGALVGGLKGGLDKKYLLDYEGFQSSELYQQFDDMGMDLEALAEIVSNK